MLMKLAAIYARVSSDQQREAHTIASQTAALIEFAKRNEFDVPKEWIFEDEGHSGATLERPALERVRDLAAEGQIRAVLVYAPDRLSRKYAYQVLLMEEFARNGVETRFVRAAQSETPEDQLLLQFQGMIAEYERAQTLERSRRGKRHRAKSGEVSVLSNAPYGYLYVKKTDESPAAYRVIETEARVVRRVYKMYTSGALSIGEITRKLNEEGTPTRKKSARWERSVVWGILRNPAYSGMAAFGKTRVSARERVTRTHRRRLGVVSSETTGHQRPREDWIEIPVPPLVTEEVFAQAQERLQENKAKSKRRTIAPSVVQGLVSCQKCGYAFSRTSTQTSARKLHYYKCIGSEAWRKLGGPVCDNNRFVRQDLLDEIVWTEVVRLLEDPTLIRQEIDRRLEAARESDPTKKREQSLQQELARVANSTDRLLNAYQEQLLSIEKLRERMPPLRQREQALRSELQAIADQTRDRATFLQLAETLTSFLAKLRKNANTLDVMERQRIVRLLVKEILVGEDTIVIRHSIPVAPPPVPPAGGPPTKRQEKKPVKKDSLLRSGRDLTAPREHLPTLRPG
jgi:site-specific DNA recombinase